ncbi:threonylcarbamoyl-AMP synthase [Patescibacteria group bacterium]|nr:threonylcarbamoyl-AMP synthase [Patescibacteria group bacterium]MBU0964580.1 threonylcarbamoyl-AMP synthase [Patescibacteria group bacterium]
MEVLKIDLKNPSDGAIKKAAGIILNGGVVAYPTDTAYGLAVNALDEKAIGKLFILKHRVQKPLPVIVDSQAMLQKIAVVKPKERQLCKKYWPGALTIIFAKKKSVPPFLTLGLPTIGVRIPDSKVAVDLVKACRKPLTSTSANISGKGNCYDAECVNRMFQESEIQPDLLLDGGDLNEVPVSTVAQLVDNKVKVIRQGPVKIK